METSRFRLKDQLLVILLLGVFSLPANILSAQEGTAITRRNADQVVELARLTPGYIYEIAVSPTGDKVALAGEAGAALLDLATGKLTPLLSDHAFYGGSIAFSPDGRIVAAGGLQSPVDMGSVLHFWDVTTGETLRVFEGHEDWVMAAAYAPDGTWFVSVGSDATIRIWGVDE